MRLMVDTAVRRVIVRLSAHVQDPERTADDDPRESIQMRGIGVNWRVSVVKFLFSHWFVRSPGLGGVDAEVRIFTADLRRCTRMQCAGGGSRCFGGGAERAPGRLVGACCVPLFETVDDALDLNA
jgi:hypothetical protein